MQGSWQRIAALVNYCLLLWYWTSMLWSIDTCQNKVSTDQYQVSISRAQACSWSKSRAFLQLIADQVLVFDWVTGSFLADCWKQGGIFLKVMHANPGLKVNLIITFCSAQSFFFGFAALFWVYGDYWNSKQSAKQYTDNLTAKLQNWNQNSTFSWVSLLGRWETWLGATPEFIYSGCQISRKYTVNQGCVSLLPY